MNKKLTRSLIPRICAFAIASSSSAIACANEHLEWHEEGGGGWSSGFDTTVVSGHIVARWVNDIPGATDAIRFPNIPSGGSANKISKDGKIENSKKPGTGCTVPKNYPNVKGVSPGNMRWRVFVDSRLGTTMWGAIWDALLAIDNAESTSGGHFSFGYTAYTSEAQMVFVPPSVTSGEIDTNLTTNRSGFITSSWTAIVPETDPAIAAAKAITAIGMSLGISPPTSPFDPSYPNGMYANPSVQKIDPCTAAAIHANVNQGKN